jgi:NAD(P)-dependent dehydrogenase (short-subunit alcohol dehydrogenase family)
MSKVWLITGSGNGLGRDIAEAALAAGNSVVAGARRTEELAPLVAQSASFHSVRKSWRPPWLWRCLLAWRRLCRFGDAPTLPTES